MQLIKQDANGRRYIVYCCDRCGEILEGAHSCSPNPVIEQLQRENERLEFLLRDARDEATHWLEKVHQVRDDLAAAQAREAKLREAMSRFVFAWDNSGSSGAWPVVSLKHLREALAQTEVKC